MYHAYPLARVSQCGLYIYFLVHYSTMVCHVTEAYIYADTHPCMSLYLVVLVLGSILTRHNVFACLGKARAKNCCLFVRQCFYQLW